MSENKLVMPRHHWGLFSCFSVKLFILLNYVRSNQKHPDFLDCSKLFSVYKINESQNLDSILFEHNNSCIEYDPSDIFSFGIRRRMNTANRWPYKNLPFSICNKWVQKYFRPSQTINSRVDFFETKYNFSNKKICSVFYRGLDKIREIPLGTYACYIEKAQKIREEYPDISFYVQTDETEFKELFLSTINNSFAIDEIATVSNINKNKILPQLLSSSDEKYFHAIDMFAATILMSRSDVIITHSGNMSLWTALYRNHTNNFYQFINDRWE